MRRVTSGVGGDGGRFGADVGLGGVPDRSIAMRGRINVGTLFRLHAQLGRYRVMEVKSDKRVCIEGCKLVDCSKM